MTQVTKRQPDPRRNRRGSAWRACVLTVAVLAAALAAAVATGRTRAGQPPPAQAGGRTGRAAQQVTVFPASSLAPARGALFGAWVQATGYSGPGAEQAAVAAFERAIGRNLAIDSLYVAWAGPMPSAAVRWDLARGTVPMITWAAARADQIAAGADDATIRAQAAPLKAMLIGEFGTVEGSAGAKATWLAQAERVIQTRFPAIRAVVYFNSDHQNFGRYFDWKVTTSRLALTAFRTFAHDPYFSAMPRP